MKVDNKPVGQRHSCPGNFVNPVQLDMDQHGTHSTPNRRLTGGLRVSTKSKAPPPPPVLDVLCEPGFPRRTMDQKDSLLEQELSLLVVLPGGVERTTTVPGSKPMMDLLVMLCAKYHLNPSGHTIELITTNRNHIKFKPNVPIGTLEAEKVLLKPKGGEDKNKKAGPQMPEATVRLVINYKKTQKTILRVNPRVPLQDLLPAICEKCEFDVSTTVLLKELMSPGALDLSCSLNDCGVRELYAKDNKGLDLADRPSSPVCPASQGHHHSITDTITPGKDKLQKEKENKGLFSVFRRSRKTSEQCVTASAPASPVLIKPRPLSMASLGAPCSFYESSSMRPADMPKKRRAPLPPMPGSQSGPSELSPRPRISSEPGPPSHLDQTSPRSPGSSSESSLRRTKRKAPPPPSSPSSAVQEDASLEGSLKGGPVPVTLEEITEQEEASVGLDSSAASDIQEDNSSLTLSADVFTEPEVGGDASSDASPGASLPGATGEDQPGDLSSDGKPAQVDGEDKDTGMSSDLVNTDSGSCQVEVPREQTDLSSSPAGGEVRAPVALEEVSLSEPPGEKSVALGPLASSTPCPPGEDAMVQTDSMLGSSQSEPPQVPVPAKPTSSETGGQKRDMATSTEELCPPGPQPASPTGSEPLPASPQASEPLPASPQASEPIPASSQASEPLPASPQASEPIPASSQASEPLPASPQASEPIPASSQASEPLPASPQASQPLPASPQASKPPPASPQASEPLPASPQASQPLPASPQASEPPPAPPQASEPLPASPQASEPLSASPQASQPLPASPQASQPLPASPQASEPLSASPQASQPLPASPQASQPLPASPQASQPLPAKAAAPFYATDSEPKPKPSNELTRDYIPKVGMTTYTIVPQKSLEKLRFFEVELTLEPRPVDPEQEVEVGSLKLEHSASSGEQGGVMTGPPPVQPLRKDSAQTGDTTNSDITVNSSMTDVNPPSTPLSKLTRGDKNSFPTDGGVASVRAAMIAEVKEMKIPPATRPKPGSFRLPQHKGTPGCYVTSAAVKSSSVSPRAGQKEAPVSLDREAPLLAVEEERLPPAPVLCLESSGTAPAQFIPEEEVEERGVKGNVVPSALLSRQTSVSTREPPAGLSLEKLRTFAAPRPYSPSMPSRFAQAVCSAVRRSQSVSSSPTASSPQSPPFHPVSGRFSIKEPRGLAHCKEADNSPEREDKATEREGKVEGRPEESTCGSASDRPAHPTAWSQPEQSSSACGDQERANGDTDTPAEDVVLP